MREPADLTCFLHLHFFCTLTPLQLKLLGLLVAILLVGCGIYAILTSTQPAPSKVNPEKKNNPTYTTPLTPPFTITATTITTTFISGPKLTFSCSVCLVSVCLGLCHAASSSLFSQTRSRLHT